jgi:Uma2 family endonuclease
MRCCGSRTIFTGRDRAVRIEASAKYECPMAVSLKLPLVLVDDADLVRVSEENPGYQFEREENGTLTVSPTLANSGAQSAEVTYQLVAYAKRVGGRVFDSSTGFRIGRAVKCPDAAWVCAERIERLSERERSGFWPGSPDVAIEVKSASDAFAKVIAKLQFYMKHGSRYAVAIDPAMREIVELGEVPPGLSLDFDAIMDA